MSRKAQEVMGLPGTGDLIPAVCDAGVLVWRCGGVVWCDGPERFRNGDHRSAVESCVTRYVEGMKAEMYTKTSKS